MIGMGWRALAVVGGASVALAAGGTPGAAPPAVTVLATGLENPRGLTFGPDGNLYVAEGGTGGSQSSVGQCQQVPPFNGPYTGGLTARISAIDPETGTRRTVVDGLPSSQTAPAAHSNVSGVADLVFAGRTLYALEAGAGCSHGLPGTFNGIFRVGEQGVTPVANLSAFIQSHPVANPEADDFEPDGTWYSMVRVDGALYAVEPNHGEVDRVGPRGDVTRLVDISAAAGHIVPTGIMFHKGAFYLVNLNPTDLAAFGHSSLYRITRQGSISVIASGLHSALAVAFHRGHFYVLESWTVLSLPAFFSSGDVVRLNDDGSWTPVITGLSFPTAMTFGRDGALYVSNKGFGQPTSAAGEILKVALDDD